MKMMHYGIETSWGLYKVAEYWILSFMYELVISTIIVYKHVHGVDSVKLILYMSLMFTK